MEARKLLYSALAVAPAVLMVGIGFHSRTYVDPFEWPAVQEDHVRTSAYIPLVIETLNRSNRPDLEDSDSFRQLAMKWIDGERRGDLKPLVPTALDENALSGKKATVFDANQFVVKRLIFSAERQIGSQRYDAAASDLILGANVLSCLKYSSFMGLYRSNLMNHSLLRRIEIVYPRVSPSLRKELAVCMASMQNEEHKVREIAAHAKQLALTEAERYKQIRALEHDPDSSGGSSAFFEHPALAKASGDSGSPLHDFSFEAHQCQLVDQRNRLMIKRIMNLSSRPAP